MSNEVQTMVKQEERDERSRLQRLTEGQRSVEIAKDEAAYASPGPDPCPGPGPGPGPLALALALAPAQALALALAPAPAPAL